MDYVPAELQYTKSHEWVKKIGDKLYEIGITDHAQSELGDIVFINLPKAGDEIKNGAAFADVESVKAVSDIMSPVNGTVKEANAAAAENPASINADPYAVWLIRAEGELDESGLLTAEQYKAEL